MPVGTTAVVEASDVTFILAIAQAHVTAVARRGH